MVRGLFNEKVEVSGGIQRTFTLVRRTYGGVHPERSDEEDEPGDRESVFDIIQEGTR